MTTQRLHDILPTLHTGDAIGHRNLTLVPLRGEGHRPRFMDYRLACEAIADDQLIVTEVDEAGSVPELLAENTGQRPVLLLDGEELTGAKQNRILNASILLPGWRKLRIPVSCVEQGRWNQTTAHFACNAVSPSRLRQRKSRDVRESLRSSGQARADQSAVWEDVQCCISLTGSQSNTSALSDGMKFMQDRIARYQAALPWSEGCCGLIAAVDGRFIAADIFDSPDTMQILWDRLVASYAFDAAASSSKRPKTFSIKAAEVLLEHAGSLRCQGFDTVGIGRDFRFEAQDIQGHALTVDDYPVHMSLFPPVTDESPGESLTEGPIIRPPSQRKRT